MQEAISASISQTLHERVLVLVCVVLEPVRRELCDKMLMLVDNR